MESGVFLFLLNIEHGKKGDCMATSSQITLRLKQAKNRLALLNKEVTATKANIKKLESEFKKARMILIAQAAEKRKAKEKQLIKK
jgi:cell division protein FtsB